MHQMRADPHHARATPQVAAHVRPSRMQPSSAQSPDMRLSFALSIARTATQCLGLLLTLQFRPENLRCRRLHPHRACSQSQQSVFSTDKWRPPRPDMEIKFCMSCRHLAEPCRACVLILAVQYQRLASSALPIKSWLRQHWSHQPQLELVF